MWLINAAAAPGWPDASSLWGEKRARAGGGDPAGPRGSVPIQDQGSYWDVTFGGAVHLRKAMSHFITFHKRYSMTPQEEQRDKADIVVMASL